MIRGKTHSRAALFFAAIQLALGFGLSLNLVLCHSANGHVAIESAFADDCCTSYALPEPGSSLLPSSDCGGCTDTPLLEAVLQRAAASDRGILPPPQLVSLGFCLPSLGLAPSIVSVRPAEGALLPAVALSVRRSIVLLV